MQKIKSIVSVLRVIVKYGAFITVTISVINFAIDEFEKLSLDPKNQ